MSNSITSEIMDKQIMDLSNSQISSGNHDFIDFMNRPPEKKDDAVASYDFVNSSNRNYGSHDANSEPAKFALGKNQNPANESLDKSLVSEIDSTMKKYADNLMHAIDGLSARVSQLETQTRKLENSVDDMKVSLGNNNGTIDGKMRQMDNILTEVLTGVNIIKDKQEEVEAQLKLHIPKVEQNVDSQNSPYSGSAQPAHQQFSTLSLSQPPPPPPHQLAAQFPQYPSPPGQTPENPNSQYQIPPPHQHHPPTNPPPPPPPTHMLPNQFPPNPPPGQNPENPNLQYQLPHPHQQHNPPPSPPQSQYQSHSQPHPSFSSLNPVPPQHPPHHPEGTPHAPPQTYPPPSSQQFYGPGQNAYDPPSSRPGPGYSGPFGPTSGHGEPFPYNSGAHMKPHQLPSPVTTGQGGGSGYPQLPTARILPQAPSSGGGGSGSGGPGNRVPIDDVVDKVTTMGFPREQVRMTVQKLTENGEVVDLNTVLDKLMNGGEGRVWFGR